jgi:hypothetical protein
MVTALGIGKIKYNTFNQLNTDKFNTAANGIPPNTYGFQKGKYPWVNASTKKYFKGILRWKLSPSIKTYPWKNTCQKIPISSTAKNRYGHSA